MLGQIPYLIVVALMCMGLYILLFKKNLIKIAMGIILIESAANLFLITLAYKHGTNLRAPVFTSQLITNEEVAYSLPTPHALTLTSIVIGVATTALLLAFIMQLYRKFGVTSTDHMRRLKG